MLRATKPLSCLLLLITALQGIDVIPQPDHLKSDSPLSHPEEILPAEVWESILDYLPVTGQATLAAVHPFFRDDFFWERRFRISFPGLPLPTANIKSLCRYVLVTQAIDTKFRDPMAINLTPQTYNWILETTFIAPVADQLTEYVAKIYEARQSLEEHAQTIKTLAGNDPELSRAEFWRLYQEVFGAAGDEDCQERLRVCQHIFSTPNPYFTEQNTNSYLQIKHYLEYWGDKGDNFAQNALFHAAITKKVGFSGRKGREYLEEYAKKGSNEAQNYLNQAASDSISSFFIGEDSPFTKEEGEQYLRERATQGNQYAIGLFCSAAVREAWDFTSVTGRAYLEEQASKGILEAQAHLNLCALVSALDFIGTTGRSYLGNQALKGDEEAQYYLYEAAFNQSLGFTVTTGRAYLEDRAYRGDKHAKNFLQRAALGQTLGFTAETGRIYLETQAENGDSDAQALLNSAAYASTLGFTEHTGRQYLEAKAAQGKKSARERLNWAACKGSHGFTEESGKDYLLEQIKKGDGLAVLHFYLINTIREQDGELRLHQYGNCGQPKDKFLSLVDLNSTFQKIKTKETDNQIAFADFMAEFEPIHAIPVRWFFSFFNTLLGRNNENA